MGFDLALGGLILISAIRGWMRGFVIQAIRLGALPASAYAAIPVRDQVRPYGAQYFASIKPELMDKLLFWVCAVASYLVIVGVTTLAVSVTRRKPYGLEEPNRGDNFAGFGLGVIKGAVVVAFLVSGLHKQGQPYIDKIDWAAAQAKESYAWKLHGLYHPADQIWESKPVRQFVSHVRKNGFLAPATADQPATETAQTETPTPHLMLPANEPEPVKATTPFWARRYAPLPPMSRGLGKSADRSVTASKAPEPDVETSDTSGLANLPLPGFDAEMSRAFDKAKGILSGLLGGTSGDSDVKP